MLIFYLEIYDKWCKPKILPKNVKLSIINFPNFKYISDAIGIKGSVIAQAELIKELTLIVQMNYCNKFYRKLPKWSHTKIGWVWYWYYIDFLILGRLFEKQFLCGILLLNSPNLARTTWEVITNMGFIQKQEKNTWAPFVINNWQVLVT